MLQAAEIERLNQFLQEYQIRYRELERKELDRHSYEIQIKELTEKLRGEESSKLEIQKLKDYIKKLTVNLHLIQAENEELKRTAGGSKHLSGDYEKALRTIDHLMAEVENLRRENSSYSSNIENYKAQLYSLERAKNREIEELYKQIESYRQKTSSIQETNSLKLRYENDIRNLERELSRSSEMIKMKNLEIEDLISRNRFLEEEARQASGKKG